MAVERRAEVPQPAVPSSHYYLGSLSRTSRTFYFPDSRDLLEVLGGLPWQRESQGGSPRVREDPLGTPPLSLQPREGPENLGSRRSWRSKIMNPSNNDYWVVALVALLALGALGVSLALRGASSTSSSTTSTTAAGWIGRTPGKNLEQGGATQGASNSV